jgi:hypothetical protein
MVAKMGKIRFGEIFSFCSGWIDTPRFTVMK